MKKLLQPGNVPAILKESEMTQNFLHPNFRLGVLGGGQLGRMLLPYALKSNIQLAFMDADSAAPCSTVSPEFTIGDIQEKNAVFNFGKRCDILTIEIERVNVEALEELENIGVLVRPSSKIIKMVQDKYSQKKWYQNNGFPIGKFIKINNKKELFNHLSMLPAVQKLRRDGYDGRGVQIISNKHDIDKGFDLPSILESKINFKKELAITVARNPDGKIVTYPLVEMIFHPEANLVEQLESPASLPEFINEQAKIIATSMADKLGLIGILAIELFLTQDDKLLVNEIAPRPHNSGHHTIEASPSSQYEQHLRAILGLGPGPVFPMHAAIMLNILGHEGQTGLADYTPLQYLFNHPQIHVHLYGKKMTRPFRKLGHITIIGENINDIRTIADGIRPTLKIGSI